MLHILQLKSFCSLCFLSFLTKWPFLLNVSPESVNVHRSLDVEACSPSEDEPVLSSEKNNTCMKYQQFSLTSETE